MKNIVIIYLEDDWSQDAPFPNSKILKDSYEDWYTRSEKHGVRFHRASISWYCEKTAAFSKSWNFIDGTWNKTQEPLRADVVYDKTSSYTEEQDQKKSILQEASIMNNILFSPHLDNKLSQSLIFGNHMPESYIVDGVKSLNKALKELPGDEIILKPLHGSGGFGIFIGKKDSIKTELTYPLIAQEFIKSTEGIPNFSKRSETSDLRLIYIDHELIYAVSRIAKKESLFTNLHQGATVIEVPIIDIPESVLQISKEIKMKLKVFPQAHYSLDFIFDDSRKPIFIEMNTKPGFDILYSIKSEEVTERYLLAFAKSIKNHSETT